MVSKPEQKRHTNIMAYLSNFWKYICIGLLAITIAGMVGFSVINHKQTSEFNRERIELQDSIISLKQDLLDREQAAVAAEQQWQADKVNFMAESKYLQSELARVRKNYRETLAEMADLDTSELKTYFAERYGQCADTVVDSARFLLTVDVGNRIRYDLTDLDFCSEESIWQDSIINQQAAYINQVDTMVSILSVEKSYYMNRAESFEQQFNTSEQARANVQAALDKQQTLTYILGGTTAVLTLGLIGSWLLQATR